MKSSHIYAPQNHKVPELACCFFHLLPRHIWDHVCAVENLPYECEELSSEQFALNAPIPKILISQEILDSFDINPSPFSSSEIVGVSSKQHRELSTSVCNFMQNRKFGESEDGIHGRDNHLLEIVCHISGMDARRNSVTFSTKHLLRTDVYLSKPGLPPLVHVEEKANSAGMSSAQQELFNKFISLPHYDNDIQFIIGIAIAGDDVTFGKLHLGTSRGWEMLNTFDLRYFPGKTGCIRAAINVGRWARHVLNSGKLCAIDHVFGKAYLTSDEL